MWRKPLATDEGVRFIILAARETYDYELTSYELSLKLRERYEL